MSRKVAIGMLAVVGACAAPPPPPFPVIRDLARERRAPRLAARASRSRVSSPKVAHLDRIRVPRPQATRPSSATRASWYGSTPAACYDARGRHAFPAGLKLWTANRTLPCGARVQISHGGRTITVPVWDRGPYVAGRDFDLSAAAFAELAPLGSGVIEITWRRAS